MQFARPSAFPVAFVPKLIETDTYVDGGILSNFPAWVFDNERLAAPPLTPTIGFRLGSSRNPTGDRKVDFGQYVGEVAKCALFGENGLETRNIDQLHELLLSVDLGLLAFDATPEQKRLAYGDAYRQAVDRLRQTINRVPDEWMQTALWSVAQLVKGVTSHAGHLRVGIMLPKAENCLEMVYTYNYQTDTDCDDKLVLKRGQGASGVCWEKMEAVLCDLEDAKTTFASQWNMSKYQQCLIRKELKTLLSIPLFRSTGNPESGFLGVLCIDSDHNLHKEFGDFLKEGGEAAAELVETKLAGWSVK